MAATSSNSVSTFGPAAEAEQSLRWSSSYIDDLLSEQARETSAPAEVFLKALGEFVLILYLDRRVENNGGFHNRCALPTCSSIADYLDANRQSELEHAQIAACLSAANMIDVPFEDVRNRTIRRSVSGQMSIEHVFVVELTQGSVFPTYWKSVYVACLAALVNDGISAESVYRLTHIAFFSTHFGVRLSRELVELRPSLLDILKRCLVQAISIGNIDMAAECLAAGLCIESSGTDELWNSQPALKFRSLCRRFRSNEGWYLSNVEAHQLIALPSHQIEPEIRYSLFHTTLVVALVRAMRHTQISLKHQRDRYIRAP